MTDAWITADSGKMHSFVWQFGVCNKACKSGNLLGLSVRWLADPLGIRVHSIIGLDIESIVSYFSL
jgi:hypothetical protein